MVPGGEWLTKVDVGSPSEQPDGGARSRGCSVPGAMSVAVALDDSFTLDLRSHTAR
jgi:hypothetical protein